MLLTFICLLTVCIHSLYAQKLLFEIKSLPDITVRNVEGKIIISWKSGYGAEITTLNIQRSTDSIKNFATFASVLNPSSDENGVVDQKPLTLKMFYRVFIVFSGGTYTFSHSYRPVIDTSDNYHAPAPVPVAIADTTEKIVKKPAAKKWTKCIYTGKDNNVIINLPDVQTHKYNIRFYNDADKQIFTVNKVDESFLILDKVNFIHAGWFHYQLFDGDILLDKNSFFIPKDLKTTGD
jgi:hypothetical protein